MSTSAKDIQFRELKDTISKLNTMIASQNQLIQSLQESVKAANAREEMLLKNEAALKEQIDYLTKKLFGSSSEKRKDTIDGQLSLFDEAEQCATEEVINPKQEEIVKSHTRRAKTKLEDKLKGIPIETVPIELCEEESICPYCNTPLKVIGKEVVRRELQYIPARVKVLEYVSYTYICPQCNEDDEPYIVKSKAPKGLMKHSLASPSSVAWAMYQKYANGMPLYRQEKDWEQYGIELSRTTLANWIIYCADKYYKPMYDYFHKLMLRRQFLMADETTVQVLNEPERRAQTKSYMWVYRTGEDGLDTIILYGYTPTRVGDNAAEFLKGFKGYLECDGYQGYNKVSNIRRCACWARVRRYFIDAVPKGKEYDYSNPAVQGVQFCNKLFQYEDSYKKKGYSYEKRKEMRLKQEKPVLDAFWAWFDNLNPVRNTRLDKAVTYVKNRRDYLETYLEDGRCSFTNNLSENAIRPFTVGRKNWLFSDSAAGADASAIIYSIVEMAKAHELNIYKYLEYLLVHRPNNQMSDDKLEELSPWSSDVKKSCTN